MKYKCGCSSQYCTVDQYAHKVKGKLKHFACIGIQLVTRTTFFCNNSFKSIGGRFCQLCTECDFHLDILQVVQPGSGFYTIDF